MLNRSNAPTLILASSSSTAGSPVLRRPNLSKRVIGGMRFPDKSEPAPGPLSILARSFTPVPPKPSVAVQRLLNDLPPHMRTTVLAQRYPAVLERVARAWNDPRALREVFDELMFDTGSRQQGMCFDGLVELAELKEHAARVVYTERVSAWDEALGLV